MTRFTADCQPVLIGSLPHRDHRQAVDLIFRCSGRIPLWAQLPHFRKEGMLRQFMPGLPGLVQREDKIFVDSAGADFESELLQFFEDYLAVTEGQASLEESRFAMDPGEVPGFFAFLEEAASRKETIVALKGQITGPITFSTGLVDQDGRALFYDDQLRDCAVKLLAQRARYQARLMARIKRRPLLFFDEPGLAGYGSSAFITITPEDITSCLGEVFEGVRAEGGLTGVHVCANTEWPVIFASGVDIVSFDGYNFFDKLILFADQLRAFFDRGGILATGIVPTTAELIEREDSDSLVARWADQLGQLERLGIARDAVVRQSLITPSCGTGTVSEAQSLRVLEMTREVSERIRERYLR